MPPFLQAKLVDPLLNSRDFDGRASNHNRRNHWGTALEPQQLAHVCFHVSNFDLPANREAIGTTARNQGWTLS